MIPFLVTVLDLVNDEVIKDLNNGIEEEIDDYVRNNLSKNIVIPVSHSRASSYSSSTIGEGENATTTTRASCGFTHTNFYYGKIASSITSAEECSIYRWSVQNDGKLVEANRGLNIKNIQSDFNLCQKWETKWYWGGNSPINLSQSSASRWVLALGSHNLKWGIKPVFDIAGSKEVSNSAHVPSPLDCYDINFIVTSKESVRRSWGREWWETCELDYRLPIWGSAVNWTCNSTNAQVPWFTWNTVSSGLVSESCVSKKIMIDGGVFSQTGNSNGNTGSEWGCSTVANESYNFKSIPSIITHKSPTALELSTQINAMATPDLPVDRDRYVDFISAKTGWYARIDYPHLFRLNLDRDTEITLEHTRELLDVYLSNHTKAIDALSNTEDSVDLKWYIQNKSSQDLQIGNETKPINHLDTLAFCNFLE